MDIHPQDNGKIDADNEIINEIINEPEPEQDNNEEINEENRLNEDSDYNILPDANFSSDMDNLTAYLQKVNGLYQNTDTNIKFNKLIMNDDKVVELSWKKPFMNGYITKLQSEIVTDSSLSEEQQNMNTKNSYYIEALNNHREYYLINKNDVFVNKLISSVKDTIQNVFENYIQQNKVIIEVDEPVKHFKFKNKHPDILFYNHKSHNIVIKWNNGDASNDAFLNHIETKGKTILFTFVTCEVNEKLYDEYIKPNFLTEYSENESKYYFFNKNFLVTFLPLLKFLPRDILPFAIARANALKYTFENQPYLNDIMDDDEATKQNKTLQHGIMELFLLIKDNIYISYLDELYPDHSDEINSRIFQIIEWAATVSNAKVTVISKNMEKQIKKPIHDDDSDTGENNQIITEPVKKTTGPAHNECPVERNSITEDGEQTQEETYENLIDFYSNFDTELLDYYPDLYILQKGRYQPDPFRKLPSLRQLSRLISSIFCLYLLLNDKGYASVSGGDLFRYLLYDEIKTSADLDYVFWLNNENDKNEIIYKLISSLVLLIAFLQSALYFTDLKHCIEFDMFYSPDKSYKFIIEINGKGDHNKFTMRTMNNPVKFPVTLLSVDCNLKKIMYFVPDENNDQMETSEKNADKTKYPRSENYYVLAAIDMVIKDVSKMDPELGEKINGEILRFSRRLIDIRYLTDEKGEMIKINDTDESDNYFIITDTISTDDGKIKHIDDIISGVRTKYLTEPEKLKYYNDNIQKLQIDSSGEITKKPRSQTSNKTGYPVLLTPSVTPEAMLILVNEVLKSGFKLPRIINDKDKKDKKRKDNIEERKKCSIAQMYIEIEVIELDAVNDVKTGPVFRILRGLIEMIVFKEPTLMLSLSLSIPEQYNIFIPGDNIVATKLDELLQNIISQLILDTDSDSSDTDYDGFDNDVSQSGTQTDVSLSNSDPDSSQSQESVDLFTYIGKKYPKYPLPTEPAMVTEDVIEDLNKQTNPLLKKSAKRFASLNHLIREITNRLYELTTTNTKSGKIPPKKLLPNLPKNPKPNIPNPNIPHDNRQEDFIKNGEKYIWVEEVNGEHHYRKEGDNDPTTLYSADGVDITVPPLEPILEMDTGGKRIPHGKRTLKRRRDKKKTRKTGNRKNKNKKRVSRVNKKRRKTKTRKNM
jgi:hypothetical protein